MQKALGLGIQLGVQSMIPGLGNPRSLLYYGMSCDGGDYGTGSTPVFSGTDQTDDFTVTAWIKPGALFFDSAYHTIYESVGEFFFRRDTNDDISFLILNGTSLVKFPDTDLTAGVWAHVAVTYDGTGDDHLKMYLNGVLVDTDETVGDWSNTSPTDTISQSLNGPWIGELFDIRLFNGVAATIDEIGYIMRGIYADGRETARYVSFTDADATIVDSASDGTHNVTNAAGAAAMTKTGPYYTIDAALGPQ